MHFTNLKKMEVNLNNMFSIINTCLVGWLVGWLVLWFYNISTRFGLFNAKSSHFENRVLTVPAIA